MGTAGKARRKQIEDLLDEIRRILLDEGDPLRVGGSSTLADEYDFALGKLIDGLASASSVESVARLLAEFERCDLGAPPVQPDVYRRAAEKLLRLRQSHKDWPKRLA